MCLNRVDVNCIHAVCVVDVAANDSKAEGVVVADRRPVNG